jgi:hypothetical protein
MQKIIIGIGIQLICISFFFSQEVQFSVDSLIQYENAYFLEKNDTIKNTILLKKIYYLLDFDSTGETTLSLTKRINTKLLTSEEKRNFYWNSSLINFINHEYRMSMNYLNKYEAQEKDSSTNFLLLGLLISSKIDTLAYEQYLSQLEEKDSSFQALGCLKDIQFYKLPNAKSIYNSSYIPGFGLLRLNEFRRGSIAFTLSTLSVMAIVQLVHMKVYFNAITWGVNLVSKFYFGNFRLTERKIKEKEEQKKTELTLACELSLQKIILENNISFKK